MYLPPKPQNPKTPKPHRADIAYINLNSRLRMVDPSKGAEEFRPPPTKTECIRVV